MLSLRVRRANISMPGQANRVDRCCAVTVAQPTATHTFVVSVGDARHAGHGIEILCVSVGRPA